MFKYLLLFLTTIPYTQIRPPYNSTVAMLSKVTDQSGLNKYCSSTTQSTACACSLSASEILTTLNPGVTVLFTTDTSTTPANFSTLIIDSVGDPVEIFEKDGVTPAMLLAGEPYLLYFDGHVWRVVA